MTTPNKQDSVEKILAEFDETFHEDLPDFDKKHISNFLRLALTQFKAEVEEDAKIKFIEYLNGQVMTANEAYHRGRKDLMDTIEEMECCCGDQGQNTCIKNRIRQILATKITNKEIEE